MDIEIKEKLTTKQWCPPNWILQRWTELVQKYGSEIVFSKGEFKKAREMRAVAISLFGQHFNDGYKYLMLPASEIERTPDVYTLYQTEHPVWTHLQTVEVVSYKGNATGDVGQFILDKKLLNKKKDYDEDTIILCEICIDNTSIDFTDLYKKFNLVKFKPKTVYILGEIKNGSNWRLSQVWPTIAHLDYNVVEQANKYPVKRPSIFRLGQFDEFDTKHMPDLHTPDMYQMFDIDEKKLRKKYGIR